MKRQVFLVWFTIFIVWALYRAYIVFPEWLDEFIVKPLIFITPVVYLTIFKEKKSLTEIGFPAKGKNFLLDVYIGVVLGILFAFEGLLANYLKYGSFSFSQIEQVAKSGGVFIFLSINLATSISEEILGRGYLYQKFYLISNKKFQAAVISNLLFLLLHIPIMFTRLHLTGSSLLVYPLAIFILGITNSYIFSFRGSLVLPILIHTFWNMTVALYL